MWQGSCVLTVVSVSGPTEVPEASVAQLEGGLVAFPQGCAIPQREGSMLRTPISNEAILLTSRKTGQEDHVTGPTWWTWSNHPLLGEQQKATMIQSSRRMTPLQGQMTTIARLTPAV